MENTNAATQNLGAGGAITRERRQTVDNEKAATQKGFRCQVSGRAGAGGETLNVENVKAATQKLSRGFCPPRERVPISDLRSANSDLSAPARHWQWPSSLLFPYVPRVLTMLKLSLSCPLRAIAMPPGCNSPSRPPVVQARQ